MTTRQLVHEEIFEVSPTQLFRLLHAPSAIRQWWRAARVIIIPTVGGTWAAAWGENEDEPDYVSVARVAAFEPPARMLLTDYRYHAQSGPLPFEADFTTEFIVIPDGGRARLRVVQDGFPAGPEADGFFAACQQGWHDTFANIRTYLSETGVSGAAR